jgi:hypothetical protein
MGRYAGRIDYTGTTVCAAEGKKGGMIYVQHYSTVN